ncbi:unnamed protein product [Cylindrotheca closterium]|uniref:MATH domain-containing protein n=1 Tax=Cylindrotheca closterium TaxID=2856 RepID=A0AAD2JI62_9STRA|nr:unnamed protein product [Cylindrotheca closterium]
MRWRSSGVGDSAAAASSSLEEKDGAQRISANSALSSSMENDEPDSSTSSLTRTHASASVDNSQQSHESSADSAADLGDPPYRSKQRSLQQSLESGDDDDDDDDSSQAQQSIQSDSKEPQLVDDDDGSDHEIPWKPQATQSTCEFTHTIANYSQKRESGCKKAEYSSTTVDEFGNRWRLIVYVNGNGRASNHHLSLFLQVADADDLPFGWKKAVSYVLTLEHPSGSNLSYAKRNPDKTFKLCPKAIDWGWSQFITSDRIQQEGFVQDDSLIVRASVTVKSSSVSIDLEDAELYLKCAVEEGKPDAVQLCLDQGASVNCQFKDDLYTPLHTACSSSTADDSSSEGSNGKNNEDNAGSMQVLQLLLEKGADGNACNKWRETPLLIAANNGHRTAVEALLKHGADPSLCSEAGWSALTFAAHKGYDDIVALLLKAGAPVNCRVTEDSSTPLHKACAGSKDGHLTAVKLLLDNGADVHALNKWRETPLLTAANHGQAGAVEALLNADADPCKCTDTGWSPLSIAAYKGHDDVVKLLLEVGEAPTEEEDPTLSALLQAATKGLPGTVKLLLHHGADHTVTTKKGDTALSILVEQNLIDAAVDMVTEYKASVPRCSRDRKKVQRARLLINLRVKQQQREGKNIGLDEEDETDEEEMTESNTAQHDDDFGEEKLSSGSSQKNKKKKKKKKMSAEQQAKAAEEALLLELEQEDAKKHEEEQQANKKSAKKRKKKERERLLKKEQEEKRLAEERQKAEKLRKERERKEASERAERERLAAIQRKKEEEEAKRRAVSLRKKEEEERLKAAQERKTNNGAGKEIKAKAAKQQSNQPLSQPAGQRAALPTAARTAVITNQSLSVASSKAQTAQKPSGKNRGWETKLMKQPQEIKQPQTSQGAPNTSEFPPKHVNGNKNNTSGVIGTSSQAPTAAPAFSTTNDFPTLIGSQTPIQSSFPSSTPAQGTGQTKPQFNPQHMEHPAVSLFRRDKLNELFQRCAMARAASDPLSAVSEESIKKVVYRWIVRAAHQSSPYADCMIPSWVDATELTAFFQRQFISEGRKNSSHGVAIVGMEALKEAGTALSILCQNLVKELTSFQQQLDDQLRKDWTDSTVGMNASDFMQNGSGSMVVVDWANRAQIYLPSLQFSKIRERYAGTASRFLTALFVTKMRYDTKSLIFAETSMDFRLPPETQSVLASKGSVSAEVWSDPFSSLSTNLFWGQFMDVDHHFGGLKPFGSGDINDDILSRRGGSVSVMPPLDSMVTSLYLRRMIDLMVANDSVPLSFAIFLRAECLLDSNGIPTLDDLYGLDPRLRDNNTVVRRFEQLAAGKHYYYSGKNSSLEVSLSGSAFVLLQNDAGRATYGDASTAEVIRSLGGASSMAQSQPSLLPSNPFSSDNLLASDKTSIGASGSFFDVRPAPVSPIAPQTMNSDFGPVGGSNITNNPFAIGNTDQRRSAPRRGRLFDLVDDGDEDALNDVDVVSGMLENLNMDLFQNPVGSNAQDIDIEAISLMGIGAPPSTNGLQPRNNRGQFR